MNLVQEANLTDGLPPSGSFLAAYLQYASACTDAPLAYHLLVGHALLAAVTPPTYQLLGIPGGRVLSNFWGICVGRPAVEHKSTSVRIGLELLQAAAPQRYGDMNGSAEGLEESLQAFGPTGTSTKLYEISEMGDFLSLSKMAYAVHLKTKLTNLYDGRPIDRRLSKNKRILVPDPRVNCMAAVNTSMLMTHASPNDWDGGFMSRWCIFHCHTEREDPVESPSDTARDWLVDWLKWSATRKTGAVRLAPDAQRIWTAWQRDFRRTLHELPADAKVAAFGRTPTQAAKMALLQAYDYGGVPDEGPGGIVPLEAVERAITLGHQHWRSIEWLSSLAYDTDDARNLRLFLSHVPEDGMPIGFGQVLRQCMMTRQKGLGLMETLIEMGLVKGANRQGVYCLERQVETVAPVPEEMESLVTAAHRWSDRSLEPRET